MKNLNLISAVAFTPQRYEGIYTQLLNDNLANSKLFTPLFPVEVQQINLTEQATIEANQEDQAYLMTQLVKLKRLITETGIDNIERASITFDKNDFYGLRYLDPKRAGFKDDEDDEGNNVHQGAYLYLKLKDDQTLLIVYQQIKLVHWRRFQSQTEILLKPAYYFINRMNVTHLIQDCRLDDVIESDSYTRFAALVNLNSFNMKMFYNRYKSDLFNLEQNYYAYRSFLRQRWKNKRNYTKDRQPLYKFFVSLSRVKSTYKQIISQIGALDRIEQNRVEIARLERLKQQEIEQCETDKEAYRLRAILERRYIDKEYHKRLANSKDIEKRYLSHVAKCEVFIDELENESDQIRCRDLILFDDGKKQTSYSDKRREDQRDKFIEKINEQIEELRGESEKLSQV